MADMEFQPFLRFYDDYIVTGWDLEPYRLFQPFLRFYTAA